MFLILGFFGVSKIFPLEPDFRTDNADFGSLRSRENFFYNTQGIGKS